MKHITIEDVVLMNDELIGRTIESNNYGVFTVVEFSHKKKYHKYYIIKFLETSSQSIESRSNILKGAVKDYFKPSVYDVGFMGEKRCKTIEDRAMYRRWISIIGRVFNKSDSHYNSYGGKGISVSVDWLSFSNFYDDVIRLDGYDLSMMLNGEIELDKDFKQIDISTQEKIYSKDTCVWIGRAINNKMQSSIQNRFKAVSPLGEVFESSNMREFGRIHKLSYKTIGYSLKNSGKTNSGWSFEYI